MNPIDGETLEERRDQRAEQLERFLHKLTPEDRKGIAGTVNQWTKEAGVRVVPASQSLYDLNAPDKRLRTDIKAEHTFDAPPIVKRQPNQRLEAMIGRLKDTPSSELESALRLIQGEYWKTGATPTIEELRRETAKAFLRRSDRRK